VTLYIVFLVIFTVAWAAVTIVLTVDAFDFRRTEKAKNARIAWLSFFLLPIYPAVVCVALVLGPIMVFRSLGRINKENTE